MSRLSLRVRLALGGLVALAVALGLAWAGLTLLFERHADRALASDLDEIVRQIIGGLEFDPSGAVALPHPPRDPRFEVSFVWPLLGSPRRRQDSALALAVGHDAAPSRRRAKRRSDPLSSGHGPRRKTTSRRRKTYCAAAAHGGRLRIVVASDLTRLRAARDAFARDLAPSLLLLSLVLATATWVQLSLGLRPLVRLRNEVAAIATGKRSRLTESAPLEVRPLVAEVNALLEARDAEAARARGRAADLAHGLKTPLAALAGDARRLRDGGQTEIACSIEASGETMRRHVERELARARMHRGHPVLAADSTSVSEVVDALFGILKRTDKGASLALVNDAPRSVRAPMERADLTEALGNVLDNAVRYAKTTVRVSCQGDSEPLAIVVEDDGPGIEPTLEAIIRQRGGRLDESGGAGLGLSLVQDILDAYRWRMDFGSSALGGLSLRLARAQ